MRSLLPRTRSSLQPKFAFLLISLSLPTFATPLNAVQAAAAEWARIRSETSHLESDWAAERQLLSASIASLEIQADQLELEHAASLAETLDRIALERTFTHRGESLPASPVGHGKSR